MPIIGQPDVFIEPNLCIFADGIYWHTKAKDRKRDKYVNNELINQGYIVLRFLEGRIRRNIDKVLSTIQASSVMPTAHGPKERELLSRAYAICNSTRHNDTKHEKCVRNVFRKLKKSPD